MRYVFALIAWHDRLPLTALAQRQHRVNPPKKGGLSAAFSLCEFLNPLLSISTYFYLLYLEFITQTQPPSVP